MAGPIASDLLISKPLTQFALDFRNLQEVYASMLILPPIKAGAVDQTFYSADKTKLRRPGGVKRAQGNEAANVDAQISKNTTLSEERSLDSRIDIQERDAFEPGALSPDQFHIGLVTDGLMLEKEGELAATLTAPASWPGANVFTPATLWDVGGTPVADITGRKNLIRQGAQRKPNWFFISDDAWQKLIVNAEVVDRVKHTSAASVTEEAFATLIGVDKVFVMSAVENTAAEGQTDVIADIWTQDAFLLFVDSNPRGPTATFGVTSEFKPLQAGRHPKTSVFFDKVFAMWHYDQLVTNFSAGVFFDGVIS